MEKKKKKTTMKGDVELGNEVPKKEYGFSVPFN